MRTYLQKAKMAEQTGVMSILKPSEVNRLGGQRSSVRDGKKYKLARISGSPNRFHAPGEDTSVVLAY